MRKVLGVVFAAVLSFSVSGCATGRGPTTGSRAVDNMVVGAGAGAATGAAAGAVLRHPGKGAAVGAIVGTAVGFLHYIGTGSGYIKVSSDIPVFNFAFPPDDPLQGIVNVERWDWKKAVVAVSIDGKMIYRASPPYSVRVAVDRFGRHEVSAEVFIWSASAGKFLPAQKFKTDFEARPDASCDNWGRCWRATVSPSGISAY